MLIRCTNCNKLFDYAQNDGVCPECGRYHRPPGIVNEPGAAATRGLNSETRARRLRLIAIILLIVWVVGTAGFLGVAHLSEKHWASKGNFGVLEVSTARPEAFTLRGRQASLSPCEILGGDELAGLPQGHKLIRVFFTVSDPVYDYDLDPEDMLFLRVDTPESTFYLEPVDEYNITQLYPDLASTMIQYSNISGYGADQGWLYYVIPPDTQALFMYFDLGHRDLDSNERLRVPEPPCLVPLELSESLNMEKGGPDNE